VQFPVYTGDLEFLEVRVAIEDFLVVRDSVVLDPDIGVVEPVRKATDVSLPVANEKVKVVRAIALRKVRGIRCSLSDDREYRADYDQREEPGFAGFHHKQPFQNVGRARMGSR
jgi:hypothetical protein